MLLCDGAALVLSVSGGKDSDAMTHHLLDLRQSEGWTGEVMMVHADLGSRVEWHQTPDYVRDLARVDSLARLNRILRRVRLSHRMSQRSRILS